mmetsp:Transcript_80659/g.160239  ORF Transcript_80659/g.160239 Transcript_80659/m.160239 type:complete len:154 (+) Transcript_80659:337-798(+)
MGKDGSGAHRAQRVGGADRDGDHGTRPDYAQESYQVLNLAFVPAHAHMHHAYACTTCAPETRRVLCASQYTHLHMGTRIGVQARAPHAVADVHMRWLILCDAYVYAGMHICTCERVHACCLFSQIHFRRQLVMMLTQRADAASIASRALLSRS